MKVKQLIALLEKEDPERSVIIQRDAHGNGYSPLQKFWTGAYRPDGDSGRAGLQTLTEKDRAAGYGEEDVVKGRPALILVPRQ